MSYIFSKTTPATGSAAMFDLKTQLKSAGWTVKASSDATTYNSSGDQITSGSSGANGWANTNAWARIQSPDGYREFTIQRGTTNVLWRIKYSRLAKFTGGSPGTTQTASATDEAIIVGGGTDAAPTFATFFAADASYRWNIGTDNATPYTFWSGAFATGGGTPTGVLCLEYFLAAEPTDTHLHMVVSCHNTNGLTNASLSLQTRTAGSTVRSLTTVAAVSPATNVDVAAAAYYVANGATVIYPDGGSTNPISIKDEILPILWARGSGVANPGYKGVGSILKWTSINRSTGDTLTVSTTRDRIVYGSCSFPWDGSTPTV